MIRKRLMETSFFILKTPLLNDKESGRIVAERAAKKGMDFLFHPFHKIVIPRED